MSGYNIEVFKMYEEEEEREKEKDEVTGDRYNNIMINVERLKKKMDMRRSKNRNRRVI